MKDIREMGDEQLGVCVVNVTAILSNVVQRLVFVK